MKKGTISAATLLLLALLTCVSVVSCGKAEVARTEPVPTTAVAATAAPAEVPTTEAVAEMPTTEAVPPTAAVAEMPTTEAVPPTAAVPTRKYHEAPMLQEMVQKGQLPPVEERLPEDPFVVQPVERIGQYGGTWRQAVTGWNAWALWYYDIKENELRYDTEFKKVIPVLLKDYEVSDDMKVFTFYLRKGIKWSDGDPYDADDYVFWWEDVVLNDELTPGKPPEFMANGKLAKFEKVDQYTIRFTFDVPYNIFLDQLAQPRYWGPLALPSHYLRQFHPKYASQEDLNRLMKEKGFESWPDLFNDMNYAGGNVNLPALEAWKNLDDDTGAAQRFVRNPYYWKVDPEGNQLPYIDRIDVQLLQDSESCFLRATAGELDFQWRNIASLDNYPVLVANAAKGNYRVVPALAAPGNLYTIFFNYTIADPVKRALFNDIRFRQALSYAIDRQQISTLLQKGMAPPSQIAPPETAVTYDRATALIYTEFDLDKANALLDDIGLQWDANHQWRLDPQGKPLQFEKIFYTAWPKGQAEAQDLIAQTWAKIGIKVNNKAMEQSLWAAQMLGGQYELSAKAVDLGGTGTPYLPLLTQGLFPIDEYWWTETDWGRWLQTGGEQGVEPIDEVKRMYELYNEYMTTATPERRIAIEKEAFRIYAENLLGIGVLARSDREIFNVVHNRFRNVPDRLVDDTTYWHPAHFFIEE